jgi:hypothetical protein
MTAIRRLILILAIVMFLPAAVLAEDKKEWEPSTSMPGGAAGAFSQLQKNPAVGKGRTFRNPKAGRKRVVWCRHFGRECGGPAANTFCERSGKGSALGWKQAPDVGPTYVLGDRKTCDDRSCDGFASITCSDDKYRTFDKPMVVGNRLDWCLRWGEQCGKPAARAFCESQGYSRARRFERAEDVGPTHVIGIRRHCADKGCDGFKSIQCAS